MPDDTLAVARESLAFWSPLVTHPCQAFALLGNEDGETSFRPHVVGDHGEAFGPFQWHAARANAMALPPPLGCGIDVRTAAHNDQLRAAHWEMTAGSYRRVWPALMEVATLWSAVTVLVCLYEGSALPGRDIQRRVELAEGWQRRFKPRPL